jgi:hypothetical protein
MRATFALRALTLIGTLLAVGCGGAGPVSPENADGLEATDRRPVPADDPCHPNLAPC